MRSPSRSRPGTWWCRGGHDPNPRPPSCWQSEGHDDGSAIAGSLWTLMEAAGCAYHHGATLGALLDMLKPIR